MVTLEQIKDNPANKTFFNNSAEFHDRLHFVHNNRLVIVQDAPEFRSLPLGQKIHSTKFRPGVAEPASEILYSWVSYTLNGSEILYSEPLIRGRQDYKTVEEAAIDAKNNL